MRTKEIKVPFDVDMPASATIRAGDLVMLYEKGNLRYIRHGSSEIIRMIYPAIRDQYWQSAPYELHDEKVELSDKGFRITYTAEYRLHALHYEAFCSIEGRQNNSITFTFEGEALSSFLRNRIGLCVLHPVNECIGRKVVITGSDGNIRHSVFPGPVSPFQPFLDIKEMQWETENDIRGTLTFEGDVFETEDQRNWADSSFKTYGTPLKIPHPVSVSPGQKVQQQATLNISLNAPQIPAKNASITELKNLIPRIGYIFPMSEAFTEEQITRLKKIPFHHCRVEVRLDRESWQEEFSRSFLQVKQIGAQVELIVFFEEGNAGELKDLLTGIEKAGKHLFSILVLRNNHEFTPAILMKTVYTTIKEQLPSVRIGYGTEGNFAELNRNRPMDDTFDFVNFTINPQVHNSDIRSIMENLENQSDALATAKGFTGGKPIHISPLQFSKDITDPRLHTAFAALWTLIALGNISEAALVTLDGSFIQHPGSSPLYDLLLTISEFRPQWIINKYADKKLLVKGLTLENATGERLFFTGLPEKT